MFYYIMLEIPQKGGSSFQGNWWELYIQAEPFYIGQVAACLVHAITDLFNVKHCRYNYTWAASPILIVICLR